MAGKSPAMVATAPAARVTLKRETFGTEELVGCFEADGADVPPDLADRCRALEDRRMLQPAAQEETWRLTPRGTNQVRKWLR